LKEELLDIITILNKNVFVNISFKCQKTRLFSVKKKNINERTIGGKIRVLRSSFPGKNWIMTQRQKKVFIEEVARDFLIICHKITAVFI
jgi:hypothetical protein